MAAQKKWATHGLELVVFEKFLLIGRQVLPDDPDPIQVGLHALEIRVVEGYEHAHAEHEEGKIRKSQMTCVIRKGMVRHKEILAPIPGADANSEGSASRILEAAPDSLPADSVSNGGQKRGR
jgi:hypothetical protein